MHAYKPIFNHTLEVGDDGKLVFFYLWMSKEIMRNSKFYHIMFYDQATFSIDEMISLLDARNCGDTILISKFRIIANVLLM